ncbi:DUF748 domain-containing protein [Hymenobacter sp. BT175]|nr:DUF748 domain-containing protein [Hymenobacter translucens]
MPSPRRRRVWRWLAWLLGIGLVLGVATVVGVRFVSQRLDPWLRQALEKQVHELYGGAYRLRIDHLQTNLVGRSCLLRGVHLAPDPAARPLLAGQLPLPRLKVDMETVEVRGIGLRVLFDPQVVPVGEVLITSTKAHLASWQPGQMQLPQLHELLPPQLAGLRIGQVKLDDVQATYGETRPAPLAARRLDLVAHDVLISPAGAADTQRLAYAADWGLRARGITAQVPDHKVTLAAARYSTTDGRFVADSLSLASELRHGMAVKGTAQLRRLLVSGVQPRPWLERGQLHADSVRFQQANLRINSTSSYKDVTRLPTLHRELRRLLPGLQSCRVRHLTLNQAHLQLRLPELQPVVENISLRGSDLRLDSTAWQDPARLLYARSWQASTGPAQALVDAPFYRLRYQHLRLNTKGGRCRVEGLELVPELAPAAFAARKRYFIPRLQAKVGEVEARGVDFAGFLRTGAIAARQVEASHSRLAVYSDLRRPWAPGPSILTPETLGQLPFTYALAQVKVRDAALHYTQYSRTGTEPGVLTISQLNGTIRNLSNQPGTGTTVFQASGRLQDTCPIQATLTTDLRRGRGAHQLKGTLGAIEFAALNPYVEPTNKVRFEGGQTQRITFDFHFDQERGRGPVVALYTGLKVKVLNPVEGDKKVGILALLTSRLANTFVLRDSNPQRANWDVRTADVRVERNRQRSVFWLWRQSLVNGLLINFGVLPEVAGTLCERE